MWPPLEPSQIRILSLCVQRANGLFGLTLFSTGIFLTSLNLLRFLTVSFCDGRFTCSSDGTLLCAGTRIESPIASCLYDRISPTRMIATTSPLHGVSYCLSQEHGRWSWLLVQPCANECPDQTHGLPCSTLADGCLPLRSSDWHQVDLKGRVSPIGFLVSASPVLGSFSSCRLATQWIASYVLLL